MPHSESYLKEISKSDPILAQNIREGTLEPRKSFNELWMETNPGLTETRSLTDDEAQVFEDWLHGI
jgi:hypothetical protein